jgi:hypothetical protein
MNLSYATSFGWHRQRGAFVPSSKTQGVVGVGEAAAMNELKIAVDDREAFEERLRRLGGIM